MAVNAVEEVKDAEANAVCEQQDAETITIIEVRDAEVNAVCQLLDKESTTDDLTDPTVDKEIGADEMKADLREFSDWTVDVECQTEERSRVMMEETSVNTEVVDVSDGVVQVEYFAADIAVGPDEDFGMRSNDAATSMESNVFVVNNLNESEKVRTWTFFFLSWLGTMII